jgi:predicted 3-demethylubiquinone-9 3-methyltransferase (glyoxalase superfamily)/uncharacterized protein YndB with AHSA1/START domain
MPQHALDATLEDRDGRHALRFERTLRQDVETVWRALTEQDELARWHPSPFELEPRAGGAVRYAQPDGASPGDGTVTDYEPPSVLGYTWGEDHLRFELRPHDDGTLLVLTHTFDDRNKAARDAAGWAHCLDRLAGLEPAGTWLELNRGYEDAFGIAPQDATPPPVGVEVSEIAPMLMFEGNAEEAMRFYLVAFRDAKIEQLERVEGRVHQGRLRVGGLTLIFFDSEVSHGFTFTPSISLVVTCPTVDGVDALFERLSDGGNVLMPLDAYPFSARFAWVVDRFGVSWQMRV